MTTRISAPAAVLVLLLSVMRASAVPHLVAPNEPAARELRQAVAEFLTALGDGDEGKVRALFVDEGERKELLDAHLRWVRASAQITSQLKSKFGDRPEFKGMDAHALLMLRIDQLRTKFVIANEDRAV